ncbi:chloride channel protein [Leptospira jelokensis]|uniref:chloride channel protein n=1 Tax=Leptospira jelokensis TaxID=2484931 RepID=UPI00109105F9|nr:chloride channel protein [Leptospira jelokensis]TGM05040.1 chloride channel protein [Leptospira jelokensis]
MIQTERNQNPNTETKIQFTIRWAFYSLWVSVLVGTVSAFFLLALDFVTEVREKNLFLFYLLPLAGGCIGWMYHRFGSRANQGNNLLLEEIHSPRSIIPFRMTPFVFIGTLGTHLVGGSAGREGTAVQMGGSLAHQLARFFPIYGKEHQTLIILGMSAGFSAVFGTPFAAAIFSIEVIQIGVYRWKLLLPSLLVAWCSHWVCLFWNVKHSFFPSVPFQWELNLVLGIFILSIASGFVAKAFIYAIHTISNLSQKMISYPPLRPVLGGMILVLLFLCGVSLDYFGLGVPIIQSAFTLNLPDTAFLWKLLLTAITIGFGFKGGEVTPLFFIGAALGNLFSGISPEHILLFVSVGFIAVFSGAMNTPLACAVMGMELFGVSSGIYYLLATQISYIMSGHVSIYSSQVIGKKKWFRPHSHVGKKISDLK